MIFNFLVWKVLTKWGSDLFHSYATHLNSTSPKIKNCSILLQTNLSFFMSLQSL